MDKHNVESSPGRTGLTTDDSGFISDPGRKTFSRLTTFLLTYLQLYLLEIQHTQLWQLVDDIQPVMLLVGHRVPQQAGKPSSTNYGVELKTLFKVKIDGSNLRRLRVFTVARGSKSPWKEGKH